MDSVKTTMTAPPSNDIASNAVHGAAENSHGVQVGENDWLGAEKREWVYPAGPSGGVTEAIHDVEVRDTWRALEDLEGEQTRRFIAAQNEVSSAELRP
jgi:hypothetical protein